MKNFELWTDSTGKKLKTFAVIDEFDKKSERLQHTYELSNTDIVDIRNFLFKNHKWAPSEPLTGGVDISKQDLKIFDMRDNINFDFSKYDYQLSFENEEYVE